MLEYSKTVRTERILQVSDLLVGVAVRSSIEVKLTYRSPAAIIEKIFSMPW